MSASATEEAYRRYQGDWDAYNQEPVDDWGCAQSERRAFIAGAQFAAERNSKRLTDAELAAEVNSAVFHEAECEVRGLRLKERSGPMFEHWVKWNHEFGRRAMILERFATLPHYDEERA